MLPRTQRQKEILEYIVDFQNRLGYQPSYQQIARHFGVSSKATIAKHVQALEKQGLLTRKRGDGTFAIAVNSGEPEPPRTHKNSIPEMEGGPRDPYRRTDNVLARRYRLVSYAGGGGMGAVYQAIDRITGETVAVKILKPDIAARNPEYIQLFENEVKNAQQLNHPNIVKILDSGVDDDIPFMVMEWVDGESIQSISAQERLSLTRIRNILKQICSAVSFAHENNIIHLDIKPANILLLDNRNHDDFVKVIDFGLSRVILSESGTTVTRFRGTHQYCAPEQFGGKVTYRSDIYSLGATLYNLISGVVPFSTTYVHAKMHPNLELPEVPSLMNYRKIPEAVDHVISKALSKDPTMRQDSADQLFKEFARALTSRRRSEKTDPRSAVPRAIKKVEVGYYPFLQRHDSDECEFDENGRCTNQMHWGANE